MKKIAFLFSGQARCNPLSHNSHKKNEILESYNKFIFTEEFKKKFQYDIFISTDDLHLENTFKYFGYENIKNIHLLNTDFYYEPIGYPLPSVNYYIDKYRSQPKKPNCFIYEGSIYQHYKILDCYNLLENYTSNTHYDYVIRLRLDTVFKYNILENIKMLDLNVNIHLLADWDFFAIGKPDIMKCYCSSLNNKYGTYTFNANIDEFESINICTNYKNLKYHEYERWTYAPEIQLFETLFEYCIINNLNINETIKKLIDFNGNPIEFCYIER